MKDAKRALLFLFALCITQINSKAQSNSDEKYPVIGKPCPDFVLKKINYYTKNHASLNDFKGKWLILDFWSTGCVNCIKSFPKISQLQSEFYKDVQIILVGEDRHNISSLYEKLKIRYNLSLVSSYDTVIFRQFEIGSVPHIVVVDPKGIVYAITNSISRDNMLALLEGKNPSLSFKPNQKQLEEEMMNRVEIDKPLLIDGNGGSDTSFLFRSVLTKWRRSMGQIIPFHLSSAVIHNNSLQIVGGNLAWLYQLAYGDTIMTYAYSHYVSQSSYGKLSRKPILELSDTSKFEYNYKAEKGVYAYSLKIPPNENRTITDFQKMMQRDLENYFGYHVYVETRLMPYWKLVSTVEAMEKLRTKGGEPYQRFDKDTVVLRNMPMLKIIHLLWYGDQYGPPFIDETGISENIDITLDAIISDFEDLKRELQKNGLYLVKAEKQMKVIVIRDFKPESRN